MHDGLTLDFKHHDVFFAEPLAYMEIGVRWVRWDNRTKRESASFQVRFTWAWLHYKQLRAARALELAEETPETPQPE